jgi:hypothetical protein
MGPSAMAPLKSEGLNQDLIPTAQCAAGIIDAGEITAPPARKPIYTSSPPND